VRFVPDAISHLQRFGADDAAIVIAWITGSSAESALAGAWLSAPPTIECTGYPQLFMGCSAEPTKLGA
jgi:hypothetical protein